MILKKFVCMFLAQRGNMFRKDIYRTVTIFLFSLLPIIKTSAAVTGVNSSDELYKRGLEALKAKDTIHAELLFKKSIRENSDAPSYFELGKIFLKKNTFTSRNRAFENFQMAVWKDPENIDYKYEYAQICKDFARFTAIEEYKEILLLDSTQVNAWINLGSIKEKDFSEYDQSFRDMSGILAPLQEYADEDFYEAEKYYKNALAIDSANYDALFKLSLLYEKASRPQNGIPLLKRLERENKADEKVHLCLGLLYYKTSKLNESYEEYKKALSMMSYDERKDFTLNSVKSLLEPIFKDEMEKMNDEELESFIELFWKVSEPLYLTEYNERLLEHYSRVAYANLHFSVPKMGITGWKSDRGEVVLRYGEPLNRIRMRPQMGDNAVMMKTDMWNYKNFTLGFTDMAQSGNFVFSAPPAEKDKLASQFGGDSQTFMEDLRKGYFNYYDPKFEGPEFDVPYTITQLKSRSIRNHTDVLVSYGIEAGDSLLAGGSYNADHEAGLFFLNKNYDELEKKIVQCNKFSALNDLLSLPEKGLLVNTISVPMRGDSGFVALEIKRRSDNGVSANRSKIRIKKFSNNRLEMSDLLFASRVENEKLSDHFIERGNLFIMPNPANQFDKNHPPYLYYEIYNLQTDAGMNTDFEQKIIVSEYKEEDGFDVESAFRSILDILGIAKGDEKISLSSIYKTPEKDPQIYLQLDLSRYPTGKYLISVIIKDNVSGNQAETKAVINWNNI